MRVRIFFSLFVIVHKVENLLFFCIRLCLFTHLYVWNVMRCSFTDIDFRLHVHISLIHHVSLFNDFHSSINRIKTEYLFVLNGH